MEHTPPTGYYFAPPSHWPIVGSIALFFLAIGGILLMTASAGWSVAIGPSALLHAVRWRHVSRGEGGIFNQKVDMSFAGR